MKVIVPCAFYRFVLFSLVFLTAGLAQVSFQPTTYTSPNIPNGIFVADVNRDGHPDLVLGQDGSNMVTVFLNHGNGTFLSGGSGTFLTGGVGNAPVAVSDFDEDGNPDIASANCGNSPDPPQTPIPSSISILFGNGNGTFKAHIDHDLPACPDSMALINIAGASLKSLVAAYNQSTLTVLRNDSFGTFSEHTISGTGSIASISVGDFNGDGFDDVVAVINNQQVVIFYQNADGSFKAPVTIYSHPTPTITGTTTVDFNQDGLPDVLVNFTHQGTQAGGVATLTNNGNGTFTAHLLALDPIYALGRRDAAGAFNGSGLISLVVPAFFVQNNFLFSAFVFFPATGKGSWGAPIYLAGDVGGSPQEIVAADLNGDGLLDFAAAGGEDNHLFVFRNTTSSATCGVPGSAGVRICTPGQGTTVASPVSIAASASGGSLPIVAVKAYLDSVKVASSNTNTLNASVAAGSGNHSLAVNAWDTSGKVRQTIVTFRVGGSAACTAPSSTGVNICSPAAGSSVSSPVFINTAASGGTLKIVAMKAYIDSRLVASSSSNSLQASVATSTGNHSLAVNAWDSSGKVHQKIIGFAVH